VVDMPIITKSSLDQSGENKNSTQPTLFSLCWKTIVQVVLIILNRLLPPPKIGLTVALGRPPVMLTTSPPPPGEEEKSTTIGGSAHLTPQSTKVYGCSAFFAEPVTPRMDESWTAFLASRPAVQNIVKYIYTETVCQLGMTCKR